jgi:hypothetical protein
MIIGAKAQNETYFFVQIVCKKLLFNHIEFDLYNHVICHIITN